MIFEWTPERIDRLKVLHGTKSITQIALDMGTTKGSIRGMITRIGVAKKRYWTKEEEAILMDRYLSTGVSGFLNLDEVAKLLGRDKANVCRKAKSLGLETNGKRRKVLIHAIPKDRRKYKTDDERTKAAAKTTRDRHIKNGHPMAGKKHTPESLERMSAAQKERWASMSEFERDNHNQKSYMGRVSKGSTSAPKVKRGTWKAQWREIGEKKNFYRSEWEANYACYLDWLKKKGEIKDWKHEPETFWFEAIRRGTRSYKPDFRVWENCGKSKLHEVKGWMDTRSKTTLSRMAKYYPSEEIVLIQKKEYSAISKYRSLIPGWT